MSDWCRKANRSCEHADFFGYCEMSGCTEIDLQAATLEQQEDKRFDFICGYSIDKVVEIVDNYKQGNLIPIEWIKNWEEENWELECNYGIDEMIEDWEKENETD